MSDFGLELVSEDHELQRTRREEDRRFKHDRQFADSDMTGSATDEPDHDCFVQFGPVARVLVSVRRRLERFQPRLESRQSLVRALNVKQEVV